MLQRSAERSGVGDPSCVALLLLVLLLAPLLAAQRERETATRAAGKKFFLPAQMNRGGPRIPLLSFDVHQLL